MIGVKADKIAIKSNVEFSWIVETAFLWESVTVDRVSLIFNFSPNSSPAVTPQTLLRRISNNLFWNLKICTVGEFLFGGVLMTRQPIVFCCCLKKFCLQETYLRQPQLGLFCRKVRIIYEFRWRMVLNIIERKELDCQRPLYSIFSPFEAVFPSNVILLSLKSNFKVYSSGHPWIIFFFYIHWQWLNHCHNNNISTNMTSI